MVIYYFRDMAISIFKVLKLRITKLLRFVAQQHNRAATLIETNPGNVLLYFREGLQLHTLFVPMRRGKDHLA